jgi:hypothetical protein
LAPLYIGAPVHGLVRVEGPIPSTDLYFGIIDFTLGGVQFLAHEFRVNGMDLDSGLGIQVLHGAGVVSDFSNLRATDEGLSLDVLGRQGTFLIDGYGDTGPPRFPLPSFGYWSVSGRITNAALVPEPASTALLLAGLLPMGLFWRRRRHGGTLSGWVRPT